MSNFVPKPNTGTLWPNDRKTSANQPDMRGDIVVDRLFLQDMVDKCEGDLVKLQISGWEKVIASKHCLSLSVQAPYVKEAQGYQRPRQQPAQKKIDDDQDVPF